MAATSLATTDKSAAATAAADRAAAKARAISREEDLDAQGPSADLVRVYLNGIGKTALLLHAASTLSRSGLRPHLIRARLHGAAGSFASLLAALLVFAAGRGDVTDVLVDGMPVVRDRRSTRLDTSDLLERARARGAVARAAVESL